MVLLEQLHECLAASLFKNGPRHLVLFITPLVLEIHLVLLNRRLAVLLVLRIDELAHHLGIVCPESDVVNMHYLFVVYEAAPVVSAEIEGRQNALGVSDDLVGELVMEVLHRLLATGEQSVIVFQPYLLVERIGQQLFVLHHLLENLSVVRLTGMHFFLLIHTLLSGVLATQFLDEQNVAEVVERRRRHDGLSPGSGGSVADQSLAQVAEGGV